MNNKISELNFTPTPVPAVPFKSQFPQLGKVFTVWVEGSNGFATPGLIIGRGALGAKVLVGKRIESASRLRDGGGALA